MQWEKLICNVAYSAPCTLTGLTIGKAMDDPDIGPVSRAAAIEAWTVARARGIAITVEDPVAHVRAFGSTIPHSKPSLQLDYEAGRRGEIDVINGAIPREAAKRSEEHTSELQSLMRISYAVFCLKQKNPKKKTTNNQRSPRYTRKNE